VCKDFGVASPRAQHQLYLFARDEVVVSMQDRGIRNADEGDEGFDDHFMDTLKRLIHIQPGSQETIPPTLPLNSPYRNPKHRMSTFNAKLPVTRGIGNIYVSQNRNPANSRIGVLSPQGGEKIKMLVSSNANILIPLEARQPLELPTLMEDPNVAGALVGLTAPRQPGETIQSYDQHCAAVERMRGSPTPAFFGQAGERSAHRKEQPVPSILPLKVESIKVNPLNLLPTKKPKRIPMAEKLEDRVAYQRMRNEDLSKNGGSHYDDQGIVFSTDGKVLDEMK